MTLCVTSFFSQFRHKVRFEGMELPPSRSSSTSDCKSLCLPPLDRPDSPPTPDSVDAGSEASWCPATSSPCSLTEAPGTGLGLGPVLGPGLGPGVSAGGTGWREREETEASLRRLLPTLDALLQQLDRVTMATEDLYHMECRLERAQRKRRRRGRERGVVHGGRRESAPRGKGEDRDSRWRERKNGKEKHKGGRGGRTPETREVPKHCGGAETKSKKTPVPFLKASTYTPAPDTVTPDPSCPHVPSSSSHNPPPKQPLTTATSPAPTPTGPVREPLPPSSLFNHPAHTTTIPTQKRKRKPPPLRNKVHPNVDRHSKS